VPRRLQVAAVHGTGKQKLGIADGTTVGIFRMPGFELFNCYSTGKKTPGGAGTHTDTGQTRDTRTADPHNHPNPPTHPRDR
jgi:hypothetical protein